MKQDEILFVSATAEEAAHVTGHPVLITGIGTTRCAVTLMEYLAERKPRHIINIGTAGSLGGLNGIFEISSVLRHDVSDELIAKITGKPFPNEITLRPTGLFPVARLATGDSFIADVEVRDKIAARADLVDMEGHVVAFIGRRLRIPVTLLKQVSDQADDSAARTWAEAVAQGALELASAGDRVVRHIRG